MSQKIATPYSDEVKLRAIKMRNQGARNCIIVRELGIPESTLRGWLDVTRKTNSQSQGQKRRRKESEKVEEPKNSMLREQPRPAKKRQQVKSVANERVDENLALDRAAEVFVPEIDAAKIKPIIQTVDQDTFLSWLGVYAPNNVPLSKPRGRTRSTTAEFRNAK